MFFTDDKRVYTQTIEKWIKHFRETLDENPVNGSLSEGYDSGGHKPPGVKITFDGYGMHENEVEDFSKELYTIFLHEDSATSDEYPSSGVQLDILDFYVHNPDVEVCIWVWYNSSTNEFTVIPFEDGNTTNMPRKKVYKIIEDVNRSWYC